MANRVVIDICGEEYTFVAEESSAYMQRVGAYVDGKMREVLDSAHVGRTDAAVLTAANIADELFKAQASAEQLRGQIKRYVDEAGKAQLEVSELKREIFRMQQKLDRQQRPPQKGGQRQDRRQPITPPPPPSASAQPQEERPSEEQPAEQPAALPDQQSLSLPLAEAQEE